MFRHFCTPPFQGPRHFQQKSGRLHMMQWTLLPWTLDGLRMKLWQWGTPSRREALKKGFPRIHSQILCSPDLLALQLADTTCSTFKFVARTHDSVTSVADERPEELGHGLGRDQMATDHFGSGLFRVIESNHVRLEGEKEARHLAKITLRLHYRCN